MALAVGAPAQAAVVDGACVATITMNFSPSVTQQSLGAPAPLTTVYGTGSISACVMIPAGSPMTGTVSYTLQGNLTCTSAQNVTGTLGIAWADGTSSQATVTGLTALGSLGGAAGLTAVINSGRLTGDEIQIVNLRDPLALLACLTAGMSQSNGTGSLIFTNLA